MYIYHYFGWRYPEVVNLGRVGLEKTILSKSWIKSQLKTNPGKFMGIDDIRFGTIAALRRRGISAEAIRQIILELGVKGVDALISWENIASINRKILDPISKRVFIVLNPIKVRISNLQTPITIKIPYHPTANLGYREIKLNRPEVFISSSDAEVFKNVGFIRLMEFTNIKLIGHRDSEIVAENIGGDVEYAKKLGAPIVQWVPADNITKVRIIKAEKLRLLKLRGVGEESIKHLSIGEVVQMVRTGFGRIDGISGNIVTIIYTHD